LLEIVPHNPHRCKGDDHVNHDHAPHRLEGVQKSGASVTSGAVGRGAVMFGLDLSRCIAVLCDILRGLEEFGEHLEELGKDRGGGEALDPAAPSTAGDDGFNATVQEFHREPAGRLMSTPTVSVDVLDTDSTVSERLPSEITGEIARGQGDDVRGSNNHDVLL